MQSPCNAETLPVFILGMLSNQKKVWQTVLLNNQMNELKLSGGVQDATRADRVRGFPEEINATAGGRWEAEKIT